MGVGGKGGEGESGGEGGKGRGRVVGRRERWGRVTLRWTTIPSRGE